jgi:hypothetical protein
VDFVAALLPQADQRAAAQNLRIVRMGQEAERDATRGGGSGCSARHQTDSMAPVERLLGSTMQRAGSASCAVTTAAGCALDKVSYLARPSVKRFANDPRYFASLGIRKGNELLNAQCGLMQRQIVCEKQKLPMSIDP